LNNKLNVLFLCGWYPSRVLPTNGDLIQRHAEAVFLIHNVTIIHIITDTKSKKNIDLTSEVINGIETNIAYLKHFKNPIKKIFFFIKAFNILIKKSGSIDIVHLNELFPFGVFSLYLKWFKKTPFIITEHWTDYKHPLSNKISYVQKTISKVIAKNSSFICPVTKDLENSMSKFGLKGNYKTIENVVNTEFFYPIETKNNIFSIVHISNMNDAHKNISGLLRVIANLQNKVDNFHFKMIGENADKYKLLSKELGIKSENIEFINQIPHTLVIKHLQEANLFILFSNFENLPCVILESFACGTPVISTDVGGIREHFPNNFGKLISSKDEHKLEEEIINFHNKKHNISLKKEMHTYIKSNFSDAVIASKFSNLYYKSLSK
jgi:glycosyltransferase involved in cell wall biosynthesis